MASLQAGIVGLPNVGKSTLFNALTRSAGANVANYPFCTIDPNVGVVEVPDIRLPRIGAVMGSAEVVPATVEISDIAGLVAGAADGEGLGNQFLSHIRQVDAVVHLVRAFADDNVSHTAGSIDPLRDIATVRTELALADLATVDRRIERSERAAKTGDAAMRHELQLLATWRDALDSGGAIDVHRLGDDDRRTLADLFLLTVKPVLYVVNVADEEVAAPAPDLTAVSDLAEKDGHQAIATSARLFADIIELEAPEIAEYLEELGAAGRSIDELILAIFDLLGLITYYTGNETETRARPLPRGDTVLQAAAQVHTDFAEHFVRAEVIDADRLLAHGNYAAAREHGALRIEGREYVVNDGDVILIRANP